MIAPAGPARAEHAARGLVRETPLVECAALGCLLKLESLQRTGSFKLRGALAALSRLAERGAQRVVTASAGNHGLGVACAARALGMSAVIYAPENAAHKKREGIRALGAELRIEGAGYDEAEVRAKAHAVAAGLPFVSAFDDDTVIEGNGRSLARELLAQRSTLRRVIAPVGGGGLIAGLLEELVPRGVEVVGVQPRGAAAMQRSLSLGAAQLTDEGETICSGLDGGVAERTFAIARTHRLAIILVEEDAVLPAVAFAYRRLGLLVEPAAAVVLAAATTGLLTLDRETALVLSGGNLDESLLDRALSQ